jgi:hypothetical protein
MLLSKARQHMSIYQNKRKERKMYIYKKKLTSLSTLGSNWSHFSSNFSSNDLANKWTIFFSSLYFIALAKINLTSAHISRAFLYVVTSFPSIFFIIVEKSIGLVIICEEEKLNT